MKLFIEARRIKIPLDLIIAIRKGIQKKQLTHLEASKLANVGPTSDPVVELLRTFHQTNFF